MKGGSAAEILIGLTYNGTTGRLSVEIIKGSHFRGGGGNDTKPPDTYVKLSLVDSNCHEMARSKTCLKRAQPNPLYKETFIFQVILRIYFKNKRFEIKLKILEINRTNIWSSVVIFIFSIRNCRDKNTYRWINNIFFRCLSSNLEMWPSSSRFTIVEGAAWVRRARRWSVGSASAWTALALKNCNIGMTCVPLEHQLKFNVGILFSDLEIQITLQLVINWKIFAMIRKVQWKKKKQQIWLFLPPRKEVAKVSVYKNKHSEPLTDANFSTIRTAWNKQKK